MDNTSLFFLIFGLSNHIPFIDNLMIFGARFVVFLSFILALILISKGTVKEKKAFLLTLAGIPLSVLLIVAIHFFLYESRPFVTYHFTPLYPYNPDASFPSRHTTFISLMAFSYLYYKSKWSPLFLLFLIWVGVSRVYVGVHYPIDILGGILIGIISLYLARIIVKLLIFKAS